MLFKNWKYVFKHMYQMGHERESDLREFKILFLLRDI